MNLRIASFQPLALSLLVTASQPCIADDTPSQTDMWEIIQQQQTEIEALKGSDSTGGNTGQASQTSHTSIGGYGELHYNNLEDNDGARKKELDFHRFVLFFGHEFSDHIRFFSELELEHSIAGDGQKGEIELEQAFLEFDINQNLRARAGIFLIPVGILNETHEPNTFYGVERNPVEKNIVPATWWAGGAELAGSFGQGFSYNIGLHEGLNTSAANQYTVRKGRQKTSKADVHDLAATGRIKWAGIAGLELAASLQYQEDMTQGNDSQAGNAVLFETHAVFDRGPFGLRVLYAQWNLDGDGPEAVGADEQNGFYIEPSYKINASLGIFARYNQWDNQAGNSSDSEKSQIDIGLNYWPHPDVVLKVDLQKQDYDSGTGELEGFNLGIGYQF
ncbi:MAG: porin [Gammaproteobacteria bacterium]